MAAMLDGRNNTISLHWKMKLIFMQTFSLFLPSNMAAMQTLYYVIHKDQCIQTNHLTGVCEPGLSQIYFSLASYTHKHARTHAHARAHTHTYARTRTHAHARTHAMSKRMKYS